MQWSVSLSGPPATRLPAALFSADVDADGSLEAVTAREQTLYVVGPDGAVELEQDVAISGYSYAYVTMLDDASGNGIPEVAVSYHRDAFEGNEGVYTSRFYSSSGQVEKEFYLNVNADGSMRPVAVIGDDVIMAYNAGFSLNPRGFARWDYSNAGEVWHYDLGPQFRGLSMTNIDSDNAQEMAYSNFTPHNGASGNGTYDDNNYTIILDEYGNAELKQIYQGSNNKDGTIRDHLVRLGNDNQYKILSFKEQRPNYYTGPSRIHISSLDGTIEHTFTGASDVGWEYGWADLDGNGTKKIIASNGQGDNVKLYVFDQSLGVVHSVDLPSENRFQALADVDGDQLVEIIVSGPSSVSTYGPSLQLEENWTHPENHTIQDVIASDNDGDGRVELGVLTDNDMLALEGRGINLMASVSGSQVELTWDESDGTAIEGYNVYRSTSSFSDVGNATKLNSDPIGSPSYTDTDVQIGQTYYYRVTVVAGDGEESDPFEEARVTLESAEFFAWPVDESQVSQDYATYNSGFANRFHLGIDLTSANGSRDIYSAASGEVVLEGSVSEGTGDDAYGTYVVIDHGNNLYALYAHLASKEDVQSVGQGERIGRMGESGDVSGRHLHFDVMVRSSAPTSVEDFDNGYHTAHPSQIGHPDPKTYLKHRVVRVTTSTLNVRRGPDSNADPVEGGTTVSQGQEFVSVGPAVGEWHFIYLPYDVIPSTDDSYFDYDRYGWVHGQYLDAEVAGRTRIRVDGKKIAAEGGEAKYLNVRASPDISSDALTKVWGGQRFVTLGSPVNGPGSDEPWYQIHLPEKAGATEGWIAGDFVKVVNADASKALASTTKSVSSDGEVDFGATGVDVAFSGVSGSGQVTITKFGNTPIGESGFAESNVSDYRFTIEAADEFSFGSNTEVRMDVSTLAGVGDANNVTLYRRSAEGQGIFKLLSTQYDTENSELVATTDGFSEFVLASNTEPLPVELARFEGSVEGENVILKWRTASETNNSGFAVQRRGSDTAPWTRVTFVDGAGTTSTPQTYRYRDTDLPYEADSLTYRLKQVDTDGSTSVSGPITVRRGAPKTVQLLGTYPNPARTRATVRYALPQRQRVTVRLFDALGRHVATIMRGRKDEGRHQRQIDTSRLPSGVYFLRLEARDAIQTQRLSIVR